MDFLMNLFTKKIIVTFHLKSGRDVHVKCLDFNCKYEGTQITSYTFDGVDRRHFDPIFWIDMTQIELITIRR